MKNRLIQDKKGGEKIFSIWWFFVLAITGIGIVIGVLIFYSASVDVREIESTSLYDKIVDCIAEQGFLSDDLLKEDFDILKECKLNKNILDNGDFYINIQILSKDDNGVISRNGDKKSLLEVMTYAKFNSIVNRRCNCEENCELYSNIIIESSEKYNIPDPILLISLMMQESECVTSKHSDSSYGLMQINPEYFCNNQYGLSDDKETCKIELLTNVNKNINAGAKILSENYESSIKKEGANTFNGCTKKVEYSQWKAALRRYNGMGCALNQDTVIKCGNYGESSQEYTDNKCYLIKQDDFVENVIDRYNELKKISGESSEYTIDSDNIVDETKIREDITIGNNAFKKDCEISLSKDVKAEKFPKCVNGSEDFLYYKDNQIKTATFNILTASNQKGREVSA